MKQNQRIFAIFLTGLSTFVILFGPVIFCPGIQRTAFAQEKQKSLQIQKKEQRLEAAEKGAAEVKSQIEKLKADKQALDEEREKLKEELSRVSQDKEKLQAQARQFQEIRKAAIKLMKEIDKVNTQIRKKIDAEKTAQGNRGFLLRDGKSVTPPKQKNR